MKQTKKNLLIVRAGEGSLHEAWLSGETRNWDMVVSSYCDPQKWQRDDVLNLHYVGGSKDGIFQAFAERPELIDSYEYFMIADDDFEMTTDDINRLFDTMVEYDLQIAQPSWHPDSYLTYWTNLHHPLFKLRWTNFCEVNTVGIHRKVLKQVLPLWEDNPIAWFIDFFWANLTDDPARQVAIIDDIQVKHTKPYNSGAIYQQGWDLEGPHKYSVLKISRGLEKRDPKKWGVKAIIAHGAVLPNGREVRGRWRLFPRLLWGWLKMARKVKRSQILENRSVHRVVRWAIGWQLTGELFLENTRVFIHGRKN